MSEMPDFTAQGARPLPNPQRGIASYRPTTGMEEFGAATLQRTSGEMEEASRAALAAQERYDTLVAEDATNKYQRVLMDLEANPQTGFRTVRGVDATKPEFAQGFTQKFQDAADEIGKGLTPTQKAKFDHRAAIASLHTTSNLLSHQIVERHEFDKNTEQSTIQQGLAAISNLGNDTTISADVRNSTVKGIVARMLNVAKLNGNIYNTPETIAEHSVVALVDGLISANRPREAFAEFNSPEAQAVLTPQNRLALKTRVDNGLLVFESTRASDALVAEAHQNLANQPPPAVSAVPEPKAPQISIYMQGVFAAEKSKPTDISPKGAFGSAQILESTGRHVADKMGVKFDLDRFRDDDAYRTMLATNYLQEQLDYFGGNATLAYAAYNAGPARVNEWIKKFGDPRTGQISDAEWAARIPFEETRKYVPRALAAVAGAAPEGGMQRTSINPAPATLPSVPTSRDIRAQLPVLLPRIEQEATRLFGEDRNNPLRMAFVTATDRALRSKLNEEAIAREAIQNQAAQTVIEAAAGIQTGVPLTSWDQITGNPEGARAVSLMAYPARIEVDKMLTRNLNREGGKIKTDPRVFDAVWQAISDKRLTNRTQLAPFLGHGLTTDNYNFFAQRIDEQLTEDGQRIADTRNGFFSAVKGQFDKSTLIKVDERGGEDFFKFKTWALAEERKLRDAKPAGDPYSLYDPTSPNYIGKRIPEFQRSLEQKLSDMSADLRRGTQKPPEQRKPIGEILK